MSPSRKPRVVAALKKAALKKKGLRVRIRIEALWRKRWVRLTVLAVAIPTVLLCFATGYYYVRFARLIDARLHGERIKVLPQVLARPLELRRGQSLTDRGLIDRLNDLGYAQRATVAKPGEFAIGAGAIALIPRAPEFKGQVVRVVFQRPTTPSVRTASRKAPPPRPPTACSSSSSPIVRANGSRSTRRC